MIEKLHFSRLPFYFHVCLKDSLQDFCIVVTGKTITTFRGLVVT